MTQSSQSRSSGFTLVEIALSIGIIAFAFVALMSLLPAGLTTFRRALDISICTQIAQRIVSEAQEVDFDVITDAVDLEASTSANTKEYSFRMRRPGTDSETPVIRYFDEQGNEIVPASPPGLSALEQAAVIYAVNTRIIPRVALPTGTEGFPLAKSSGQAGNLALITVQVARNPSSVELKVNEGDPSDPTIAERNLWMPKGGVDIFTYSAYIAKNQ